MTSILQKIDDSISSSRKDPEAIISESFVDDSTILFITAKMDAFTLSLWQEVYENKPDWLSFEFKDDSDDIIPPNKGKPNKVFNIDISSLSFKNNRHIFTIEGWNSLLHNDLLISSIHKVNLLGLQDSFSTLGFNASPWESKPINMQQEVIKEIPPNAKTLVRFLSNDFFPPSNIYPWILKEESKKNDAFFIKWKDVSCLALAKCFVNELYNNGERCVSLSGKPPRKITFGSFEKEEESFEIIQSVANWIFIEGQESELKHTFLTNELAREWPETLQFCNGLQTRLPLAFESAKLLYKSHVRSGSKETIKSLSDLRKTLTDDTQKIVQQSKDLTSALWKDLALSISTIIIKYALDSSKPGSNNQIFSYVFIAVSVYVFVSQNINLFINYRYFLVLETYRGVWRKKLYGFLDDDDYHLLASKPLKDASKAYGIVALITTITSYSLSGLLLYLGLSIIYPLHTIIPDLFEKIAEYIKYIFIMGENAIAAYF